MLIQALVAILTPEAPFLPSYLASESSTGERHQQCVRLIMDDLDRGREGAQRWALEGGGAPAHHCLAIADLAAGYPKLAAARLTEIAARPDAGDDEARSKILAEASLAWLDAGDIAQAEASIKEARERSANLGELDFVAAKIFAAGNRWQDAADAVSAAEGKGLRAVEAYLIRARALRALGRDEEAANDVVSALTIEPLNIDALTLRGELWRAGVEIEAYYGDANKP